MPLRITIDCGCLSHPGRTGIGRCLASVLPRLADLAAGQAEFVLLSGQPLVDEAALGLVRSGRAVAHTANFPSLYAWQQTGMAGWLRRLKPDVHYASDGLIPPFTTVPAVCLIHDLLWDAYPETLSWHVRAVYRLRAGASVERSAVALTGSRFVRAEALRVFGQRAGKIQVARCQGVDTDLFCPASEDEPAGNDPFLKKYGLTPGYVLCLGNLMAHKNLVLVVEALSNLHRAGKTPPVAVFVGLGGGAALLSRLPGDYPRERIRFLGYLTDDEARAAYRRALCLAYPSRYEGFGLPILEAMASGVPAVYANASALPETAGEAGLAVSPDDPNELAAAIARLQDVPDLRAGLVAAGLARAKLYTWDDCAADLWLALRRAAGVTL